MSAGDNTTLNTGVGGDVIRTDSIVDRSTGTEVETKIQVIKLATGRANVDGGLVTPDNPLPVHDVHLYRLMEKVSMQMDEMIAALRGEADASASGRDD